MCGPLGRRARKERGHGESCAWTEAGAGAGRLGTAPDHGLRRRRGHVVDGDRARIRGRHGPTDVTARAARPAGRRQCSRHRAERPRRSSGTGGPGGSGRGAGRGRSRRSGASRRPHPPAPGRARVLPGARGNPRRGCRSGHGAALRASRGVRRALRVGAGRGGARPSRDRDADRDSRHGVRPCPRAALRGRKAGGHLGERASLHRPPDPYRGARGDPAGSGCRRSDGPTKPRRRSLRGDRRRRPPGSDRSRDGGGPHGRHAR